MRKLYHLVAQTIFTICLASYGGWTGKLSAAPTEVASKSATAAVHAVFGYEEVQPGKVRPLNAATLQQLGKNFVPRLRKKMEAFVRAESAIPRKRDPEKNSPARNEADLYMLHDPLTGWRDKPDIIRITKGEKRGSATIVSVIAVYKRKGEPTVRKKRLVTVIPGPDQWIIQEVDFIGDAGQKSLTLSEALDRGLQFFERLVKEWS